MVSGAPSLDGVTHDPSPNPDQGHADQTSEQCLGFREGPPDRLAGHLVTHRMPRPRASGMNLIAPVGRRG